MNSSNGIAGGAALGTGALALGAGGYLLSRVPSRRENVASLTAGTAAAWDKYTAAKDKLFPTINFGTNDARYIQADSARVEAGRAARGYEALTRTAESSLKFAKIGGPALIAGGIAAALGGTYLLTRD